MVRNGSNQSTVLIPFLLIFLAHSFPALASSVHFQKAFSKSDCGDGEELCFQLIQSDSRPNRRDYCVNRGFRIEPQVGLNPMPDPSPADSACVPCRFRDATACHIFFDRLPFWFDKKDYLKAIIDTNRFLGLIPENADAYYFRGFAWDELGDNHRAIASYYEALRIQPNYRDAKIKLNESLAALEKKDPGSASKLREETSKPRTSITPIQRFAVRDLENYSINVRCAPEPPFWRANNSCECQPNPSVCERQKVEQERYAAKNLEEFRAQIHQMTADREYYATYKSRKKTLLEEVLNYSTTANEEGRVDAYWVSGENGDHACIMTFKRGSISSTDPNTIELNLEALINRMGHMFGVGNKKTDLRQINVDGFELTYPPYTQQLFIIAGDEKTKFFFQKDPDVRNGSSRYPVIERLGKAWNLVFEACPSAVKKRF